MLWKKKENSSDSFQNNIIYIDDLHSNTIRVFKENITI